MVLLCPLVHTLLASGYSSEVLIVQVQQHQDGTLVQTLCPLCWNAFHTTQPLAENLGAGTGTIALTDVTGSFISALLMLILSCTLNSCAVNYFTAHQKHGGAGLETAAKPMSQSSLGTSVRDEPPLYLHQEAANCPIGTISFLTLVFCFPVVAIIFFW